MAVLIFRNALGAFSGHVEILLHFQCYRQKHVKSTQFVSWIAVMYIKATGFDSISKELWNQNVSFFTCRVFRGINIIRQLQTGDLFDLYVLQYFQLLHNAPYLTSHTMWYKYFTKNYSFKVHSKWLWRMSNGNEIKYII